MRFDERQGMGGGLGSWRQERNTARVRIGLLHLVATIVAVR